MTLDGATGDPPVEGDVGGEGDGEILLLRADGPIERGPDVVLLDVDRPEPLAAGRSHGRRRGRPRTDRAMCCAMRRNARRRRLVRPGVPGRTGAASGACGSEARAPERSTISSDLSTSPATDSRTSPRPARPPAHTASAAASRAAAGEHRQPLEHPPLVLEEQVVAPVDHGSERLLAAPSPCGPRPTAAGSGRRAVPAICRDRERSRPARGELDRQAAGRRAGRRCRR